MKQLLFPFLSCVMLSAASVLVSCGNFPGTAEVAVPGDPSRFFVRDSLISPGVYYYPEQWPESQWERDFRNMADCGFEFTHFGEFAWSSMEPEDGTFDFGWLDKAVGMAAAQGLKVIMCTPTPTPPAWLTHRHPDVLVVNSSGQRIEHGARQQASWASELYRKYVRRIVTALAERYGDNPAVIGWQIDNEPSHYSFSYDYSENAQRNFRRWLQRKYGDIDSLNHVWGNAFWSQTYNDFSQIRIPNGKVLPGTPNPHAMLDYKRYTADEAASFINMQADILRSIISPGQWIMTNTMPGHSPVDPARMTSLDFLTYTRYLVNGRYSGYGEQGFRISNPDMLGYNNDYYRNIKGVTGVMEIQPGQVNWGKFNPQPYPGAVRLWMYHIFAGESRLVCHYRFRQPLKGSEQHHYGTMQTDGVSLSPGGRDIVRFNEEIKELRRHYDRNSAMPREMAAIRTAILVSPDNRWEMEFQPQSDQWDLYRHTIRYYYALKNMGAPVDIVEEDADFGKYPVIVAPAYIMVDGNLIDRWTEYVREGGHLVLTCRTGEKDRNAALWEDRLAGPVYCLIGAEELYFDHLPKDRQAHVEFDGKEYSWNNWGEVITPAEGTEVWARHSDQFYKGSAAVLHRAVGKGSVTYVGIDSDDGRLEKAVLRKLYAGEGLDPVYNLPEGVLVEWRDGFFVGLNYTSDRQVLPVPDDAEVLVGEKTVPPAGVCIWKAAK